MIEVVLSEEKHKEALIACADGAFGDELPEGGLAGLLPKLYGMDAKVGGNHLMAVEDGKILGLVLTEAMRYTVLEKELKIACIGTVSVAKEARGRGIMKLLMSAALSRLEQEGCDFVFLGGQRQRYAYWGFEACGTQTVFSWNQANLKHGPRPEERERIELVPIEKNTIQSSRNVFSSERSVSERSLSGRSPFPSGMITLPTFAGTQEADWELAEQARQLYEREPVRVSRSPERFFDILASWQARPYACIRQGAFAGYVAFSADEKGERVQIKEMVLEKGVSAVAVLHGLADCLGIRQGTVTVDWGKQEMMRELEEICESQSMGCSHRFLIMNWPGVVERMLELKQTWSPLEDGEAVLGITEPSGRRTAVEIRVHKGRIAVTGEERKEAQAGETELTAAMAARMLFCNTQTYYKELEGVPRSWFPLPLYVSKQDCC